MSFRTEDHPPLDRFPFWVDIVSQTVSPMHARTDHADDFRAMIRMVDLGVTPAFRDELPVTGGTPPRPAHP